MSLCRHRIKIARAKEWLRQRNAYVLDRGSRKPSWGIAGDVPIQHSPLLTKITEADRRRK